MAPGERPEADATFQVQVWSISRTTRKDGYTYRLRWKVGQRRHSKSFSTRALAESTRSSLLTAGRRGEPFDVETGLPRSQVSQLRGTTWWAWSLTYVDLKWPTLAPISRRSLAEALVDVTLQLSKKSQNRPDAVTLRRAMYQWAYHAPRRAAGPPPADMAEAIRWLERSSVGIEQLHDHVVARGVLSAIARRQDGGPAAPTTIARKRAVLHNALELAVEHRLLDNNPLKRLSWRAPRVEDRFDVRAVISPQQARALLAAVAEQGEKGRRLTSFFALMYYAALRPSEATALTLDDLQLPDSGWGELHLSRSNAEISGIWADTGVRSTLR